MPYSARENDQDVLKFVNDYKIMKVLDVGVGSGTYSDLLRGHVSRIDGIEAWEPYISQFSLYQKYDQIIRADVLDLAAENFFGYDLVIFGDVLEHMSREESMGLWHGLEQCGVRYGMISVPIVHYPQGEEFGNPYERHVQEHLTADEVVKDYGPFIYVWEYNTTGTFIAEFE